MHGPERCPCCGGGPRAPWKPGEPAVLACPACGGSSLAALPAPTAAADLYQAEYYAETSGGRFLGLAERAIVALKDTRVRAILARKPGPGSLLDVGCGRGDLLERFQARGWRAEGTQVSRTAAASATARGLTVHLGDLPGLGLAEGSFDVITFFHVLEHLPDPAAYLECAGRLLRQDGLLVVEVPEAGGLGWRILGRRHLCFDHPHHLHFFTPAALRSMAGRCGFRVEGETHFSIEYSAFTLLQNLLNLLPGEPNRLYRSLMQNPDGARLRRQPATWLHGILGALLGLPAFLSAFGSLVVPRGNTMRFYFRKGSGDAF